MKDIATILGLEFLDFSGLEELVKINPEEDELAIKLPKGCAGGVSCRKDAGCSVTCTKDLKFV